MSIFDSYNEEFRALSSEIAKGISHATTYETEAVAKRTELRKVDALLGQASDLIKQMDVEVRSASDVPTKKDLQAKVATYKQSLSRLKSDYTRAVQAEERAGLMGDQDHLFAQGRGSASQQQHDRLLQTSDMLERQGGYLESSKRMVAEIEDVAMDITSELGRNRETIQSAHSKVKETNSAMEVAKGAVDRMGSWFRNLA
ncbi:unnamed protein product [Chrysoparadoxa australica]